MAQVAHHVFFTLDDNSPAAVQALISACQTYLDGHDGVVYFGVGTRIADLDREVNDASFDVSLHVVFQDRAAHDAYQIAPRHLEFIAKQKHNWSQVRVFDSALVD
ncbi:Dabb family protein [Planctomycetaceae bacterium SH139]